MGQAWGPLQLQGLGSHPKGQQRVPQGQQASTDPQRLVWGLDHPKGQQLEGQQVPPRDPRQGQPWGWGQPWVLGPPTGLRPVEGPGP